MKWAQPTEHHAFFIAENLRDEDKKEVWLSHRMSPLEAVMLSYTESDLCRTIVSDDGEPLALTGLVGNRIWLLGTEKLTATRQRRLQLCKEGRGWVEDYASPGGFDQAQLAVCGGLFHQPTLHDISLQVN